MNALKLRANVVKLRFRSSHQASSRTVERWGRERDGADADPRDVRAVQRARARPAQPVHAHGPAAVRDVYPVGLLGRQVPARRHTVRLLA